MGWKSILWIALFSQTLTAATITFNGGTTYQTIDGFGVNANHRSWNNDELKPVIDALVDQAGMTLFRIIYDKTDWEASNDNSDPNVMNWAYYNQVYSSPEFQKLWGLTAYLNQKGVTDGVIFNFQGNGPSWLGSPALKTGMEPEWAEMIASFLIYARQTANVQFGPLGPDNEMDQTVQGVNMSASQYVTALHDLSQLLDANGMSDVTFVGPDLAGGGTTYMPQMMADPVVMSKLAHFGVHSYSDGGGNSSGVYSYIKSSAYPDRDFWVTEFNVWCGACDSGVMGTYDWAFCKGTAEYLMQHLLNNASGGIVWEAYDSQYNYYNPLEWSFWGLFGVDNPNAAVRTYTPRKNFYTLAQLSRFVRPGAKRIAVSGSTGSFSPLLAFKHDTLGQIAIVGINTSGSSATLSGSTASLPAVPQLELYYTSASANLADGGAVAINNGSFSAQIPGDCVFTLFGSAGLQVTLTSPSSGAGYNAPATIPLAASATTTSGSVAKVEFYNGSQKLGESTSPPYVLQLNSVGMGDYGFAAVATDTAGNTAASAVVNVSVAGPVAQIVVTPANAAVGVGGSQQFAALAGDVAGRILNPQPTFNWLVGGGGVIDDTGLFTAGGSPGGPFAVTASSGGFTGGATVNVIGVSGGTIGNTKTGSSTDNIYDSGAWINLSRFQAQSNMVVSTIQAQVVAIAGGYKCAVYSDKSGTPSGLLRGTSEVRSPASGWNLFPLTSSLALTNGVYYWLAIWSDDSNARIYYSGSGGTLQWGRYNYGNWPDPISTSGGSSLSYCIYATGGPPPTLASVVLSPLNPTIVTGGSQPFTLTGTYSDGSVQNVTSQASWSSSAPGVATITGGAASGISAGTTTISASLAGKSASTTLTVQDPAGLSSITLSPLNPSILVGQTQQFSATGHYSDGSSQNLTSQVSWSSSDTSVATIDGSGLARGVGAGSITVLASLGSKSASTTLSVQAPPSLRSITVTPGNSSIVAGQTQQFTATGTYSDGSTQNLTSQAAWESSQTSVATVNSAGRATGVTAGTTTISATFSSVTGGTGLTVQPTPLTITTASLPGGSVNVSYSATFGASGGTTPYAWSITAGSLPSGLTLNPTTGGISGQPSAAGTWSFTATVTDAGSPAQVLNKALSMTISAPATSVTIWPGTTVPGSPDGGPDSSVELGVKFKSDVAGRITGIRFYKSSANTGTHVANLWSSSGSKLASATFTGESGSGWQQVNFSSPVSISANTTYVASYHCNNGHYSADVNYFASRGVDNAPLHALANSVSADGVYRYGSSSAFPNQTWKSCNYWVDVAFTPGP